MLTFTASEEKSSCFKFIGCESQSQSVRLISDSISLISDTTSILSSNCEGGLDTCSFYSGPSDDAIVAFGEGLESCGSIAYYGGESSGSVAYSGSGVSSVSVASCSVSSSSSFSGGCSYSC